MTRPVEIDQNLFSGLKMTAKTRGQKPKILIVENSPVIARDLRQSLTRMDYLVSGIVKSRKEALQWIQSIPVDLVLIDIQLKKKTGGIRTAKDIQSRFDVPVVFISDVPDEKVFQQIQESLPHGFLLKPVKDAELESEIEIALTQHHQQIVMKKTESRHRQALMSTGYGVILTDEGGTITFVNPAAVQMLKSVDGRRFTGNLFREVVHVNQLPSGPVSENIAEQVIQEGNKILLNKFQLLNRSARPSGYFSGECSPIRDERNQILGMIMIFHRI